MKHGEQHTFTIIDDRILRERRDKSNTILRLLAACTVRAVLACSTHFYEYPLFVATEHTASLYACAKDCLMRRIASVSRLFHTRRRSTCWNALQSSGVAFRILTAHLRKLATVALPWALAPFGRFGSGVRQIATGGADRSAHGRRHGRSDALRGLPRRFRRPVRHPAGCVGVVRQRIRRVPSQAAVRCSSA